jgi:hypothetical protein
VILDNEDLGSAQEQSLNLVTIPPQLPRRQSEDETPSLKQQIETLDELGLRPSEISSILRRSSTHVNKELSGIRKARKKG